MINLPNNVALPMVEQIVRRYHEALVKIVQESDDPADASLARKAISDVQTILATAEAMSRR